MRVSFNRETVGSKKTDDRSTTVVLYFILTGAGQFVVVLLSFREELSFPLTVSFIVLLYSLSSVNFIQLQK